MKGRVLQFDDSVHRSVDLLLPWFVNGTLEEPERKRVERHVADCDRCQRELARLRSLREAARVTGAVPDPRASWKKLDARLDRPRLGTLAGLWPRQAWQRAMCTVSLWVRPALPLWARWAMAAQLIVIAGLGGFAWSLSSEHVYHTLGAPGTTAPGTVVVVFDRRAMESDLRRILRDTGALAIDPPTETGAYVLHVPDREAPAAIDRLRKEPAVVLVERLAAEPAE